MLILLVALPGCGGSGSASSSGETVSGESTPKRAYPHVHGPTREFLIRNGDNAVQTFGREATEAERHQVSRMARLWMRARAAQDWRKDCSFFSRAYRHTLVKTDARRVSSGEVKTCPQALEYFGHKASGSYRNNLTGPIDSLRIGEGHGYAQYHGNDGHDWVIPVERENGRWRIANATPIGRNS